MKNFLLISCLLLSISNSFSQTTPCSTPIEKNIFQDGFNTIAVQQTNKKKLDEALLFSDGKCFTSAQVKTIAMLFNEDSYRLEYCKKVLPRITDTGNIYDIYDAFTNFSYAFRLHDYVHAYKPQESTPTIPSTQNPSTTPPPAKPALSFPSYKYPNSANYTGIKGCDGPVAGEAEFMEIANNVFNQPTNESKEVAIQNATEKYCLDMAQIMKLVTFIKPENARLSILIKTFPLVYDQEAYKAANILFTGKPLQNEWSTHCSVYLTPPPPPCVEDDEAFNTSLKSIQSKTFDRERLELIDFLANDHCFTVAQIKTLMAQVYPGTGKLEALKKLYDKCPDKKNYYTLLDELMFSSEKEELKNFIKSKR